MVCAGAVPRDESAFGRGSGPIILGSVRCTGSENGLINCIHSGIQTHTCSSDHSRDAGVVCRRGECLISLSLP